MDYYLGWALAGVLLAFNAPRPFNWLAAIVCALAIGINLIADAIL